MKRDWKDTITKNRHAYPEAVKNNEEATALHFMHAGSVVLPRWLKDWKKPVYDTTAAEEAKNRGTTPRQVRKQRNKKK